MKIKKIIAFIAVIFFYALLLAGLTYMQKTESVLFLFGYLLREFDSLYGLWLVLLAVTMILTGTDFFSKPKSKKLHTGIISGIVVLVVGIAPVVYDVVYLRIHSLAFEKLYLSDGKKVLINEVDEIAGYRHEECIVYQFNGIAAKKLGEIPEIFSNNCIEEGKWDHTYDESDKKLTINIYYDEMSPYIKEEYDTGVWKQEFTLD